MKKIQLLVAASLFLAVCAGAQTNPPPIIATNVITLVRHIGISSLRIKIADLFTQAGVTDSNTGAVLSVTSVQGQTTNPVALVGMFNGSGQTVTNGTNGCYLFYITDVTNRLGDTVTYTVTDQTTGATNQGQIAIAALPASGSLIQNIVPVSGTIQVTSYGIPYYSYVLIRSSGDPTSGPWTPIATNAAASNGIIHFTDASPPPGMAFYRLQSN